MEEIIIIFCLVVMLFGGIVTIMLGSLLKSSLALALSSVMLSTILFLMGAKWSALFELSVCAGLITVIFVSAISVTKANRNDLEHTKSIKKINRPLPYILIAIGAGLIILMAVNHFSLTGAFAAAKYKDNFKEIMWMARQPDILGKVIAVLGGAFAVVVLFKEGKKLL
jgi:NADH-quinone oxidoreductase subunit J